MRKTSLAIAVVLASAASTALAQGPGQGPVQIQGQVAAPALDAAPPNLLARYSFNRVADGFLRLDTASGQVAICSQHNVGWACQAVPEDRAALEKEIARLQDQVAGLKTEVASLKNDVAVLREPPPPPRPPADLTPPDDKSADAQKLREDIERARVAVEHAWQRLVEMIANFQKDIMRKS